MKTLESIKLVQFYLYEKVDIQLGNVSAFFGDNGSGKSTILDAMQILLFGGDRHNIKLNSQADDSTKNTRKIKSYCLGQYGDTAEQSQRPQALTYITMVWRDENHKPISIGMCISASANESDHFVEGRYVLPGVELTLADHLETSNGEERPRAWKDFNYMLTEHAKKSNLKEVTFPDAKRFVDSYLMRLRGHIATNPQAFIQAMRFGLKLRFDDSVDHLVRNQILETKPTHIQRFKDNVDSFRQIGLLIKEVERKISDADKVIVPFGRAQKNEQNIDVWTNVHCNVNVELKSNHLNHKNKKKDTAVKELQGCHDTQSTLKKVRAALSASLLSQSILRDNHKAHHNLNELNNSINLYRDTEITSISVLQNFTTRAEKAFKYLSLGSQPNQSQEMYIFESSQKSIDLLKTSYQEFTDEEFQSTTGTILTLLADNFNSVSQAKADIANEKKVTSEEEITTREKLEGINTGKAWLSPETKRLKDELAKQNIIATPVCELVNISDPSWQPIIETYLRPHLEALLVSAEDEQDAYDVYRGVRDLYGAKIVMESRFATQQPIIEGSVASLITSARLAAANYLRSQFGKTMQATTKQDAMAHDRTLTVDGMYIHKGTIERLRCTPSMNYKIRGEDPSAQLDGLNQELKRLTEKLKQLQREETNNNTLYDSLSAFADISDKNSALLSAKINAMTARNAITSLEKQLTDEADDEYKSILGNILKLETQLTSNSDSNSANDTEIGRLTGIREQADNEAKIAIIELEHANNEAALAKDSRLYNAELVAEKCNELKKMYNEDLQTIIAECLAAKERQKAALNANINSGFQAYTAFQITHQEQISADAKDDWRQIFEWIAALQKSLQDTQLIDFKEQLEDAFKASQAAFKTDVALSLSNNLDMMHSKITKLNQTLNKCPLFSNGERYRFKATPRPQYEEIKRFIEDVGIKGSDDHDLFGGAGEVPDLFRKLLDGHVADADHGPLEDYREFYSFDVEILQEVEISKDGLTTKSLKSKGLLSKRTGTGSGGEHRAPLYVIAGAALASAYHLEKNKDSGIRLIILDEIFIKMDAPNIIATMRYFDELGLQVIMAGDGTNRAILNAFLNRYYDVVNDSEYHVVQLQGHDITELTNSEFRKSYPEFNPELIDQEILAMRAESSDTMPQGLPMLSAPQSQGVVHGE